MTGERGILIAKLLGWVIFPSFIFPSDVHYKWLLKKCFTTNQSSGFSFSLPDCDVICICFNPLIQVYDNICQQFDLRHTEGSNPKIMFQSIAHAVYVLAHCWCRVVATLLQNSSSKNAFQCLNGCWTISQIHLLLIILCGNASLSRYQRGVVVTQIICTKYIMYKFT